MVATSEISQGLAGFVVQTSESRGWIRGCIGSLIREVVASAARLWLRTRDLHLAQGLSIQSWRYDHYSKDFIVHYQPVL